jgi:hypothetical protein
MIPKVLERLMVSRYNGGALKIYPVSSLVNSPKIDDPRCIESV